MWIMCLVLVIKWCFVVRFMVDNCGVNVWVNLVVGVWFLIMAMN